MNFACFTKHIFTNKQTPPKKHHALVCSTWCVDLIEESKQNARLRSRCCLSSANHAYCVQERAADRWLSFRNGSEGKGVITCNVCVHVRGCYFGLMECPAFCEKGAINRLYAHGR